MKFSKMEQAEIKDLLKSEGWKMIERGMEERRSAAVNALITSKKIEDVSRFQTQIAEVDFLLRAPHQWIR